ncbi:MAG: chemotaxis protein CheW [Gemmatimonadetes bacterium]|nr:chemotaxis protein CheW [Gemmatimonadota bacterium]
MDDLLRDFLTESAENLQKLDQDLIELEQRPHDLALVHSIFRTIHTIKGTCGFIGLPRLEVLAHVTESVLGAVREGRLMVVPSMISDILQSVDTIKAIQGELERSETEPAGDDTALLGSLQAWMDCATTPVSNLPMAPTPDAVRAIMASNTPGAPVASPPATATSPAAFTPEPDELELVGGARGTFEDFSTGEVLAIHADAGMVARSTGESRAVPRHVDPRPRRCRLSPDGLTRAHASPVQAVTAASTAAPPPNATEGSRADGASSEARGSIADSSLRVNVTLLDKLMNLVGELVLARNQLIQLSAADDDSVYAAPVQHLNRVTTDLQEAVMRTRMQAIGGAWSKLPRLVRDLAKASGKQLALEMHGAETELDRQILQAIQDPLTHMVRNSADHGVELPDVRRSAGKPEQGTIRLNAYHEGGHVILEIADDGAGISVEKVRRKAVERGLVPADVAATLSEAQVFRFIFEPGFSTAEKITNVSGRGVGMDVVRSNIEKIGGTVELSSREGRGTTVRVKIPLTLAIISALLVGSASEVFAIPQIGVVELVRVNDEVRHRIEEVQGARFFRLRDTLLPLVSLAERLVLSTTSLPDEYNIIVCQVGELRVGLVVDEVFDTQEIVVKPVGRLVKHLPVYAGCTILGDGRVIMILDTTGIANEALAVTHAEQAAGAATELDASEDGATESVLVYDAGSTALQAVPLSLVARLEEIPADQIEEADGRALVQYRGALLPLLPASAAMDLRARNPRPVIVFTDNGRSMGVAVDEIRDIVDARLTLDQATHRPGVLGVCVIGGRATEIIDTNHFLRQAFGDWFAPAAQLQRGDTHVLLVDDSRFFLSLIAPVLRGAGYKVSTASDGRDALTYLERGDRYDIIISDIDMPAVDGFALAREIRANPAWSDVPLLALTGRSTPADRERARACGFDEFLVKFDREAVLSALQRLAAAAGVPA